MTMDSRVEAVIAKYRDRMTPEQLAALEDINKFNQEYQAAHDRTERAERELDKYELNLDQETRLALYKDRERHNALATMFFYAGRHPELFETYHKMTVDELVELRQIIGKQNNEKA